MERKLKDMINISVSENLSNQENIAYLYSAVNELINHAGCSARITKVSDRISLNVNCPIHYSDIVSTEIADKVAEIIVIKYKYLYFKRSL